MIVGGAEGALHVADVLSQLAEATDDVHCATTARMSSMLVRLVAEDFDRYVEVLMTDRAQLVDLFQKAIALVDAPLAERIRERLESVPADYRVTTLLDGNLRDLAVFEDLHGELEVADADDSAAHALAQEAWAFLHSYTERRRYHTPV